MSLWEQIKQALDALAHGASLSEFFSSRNDQPEATVAFAIATIALGAKMAKADGRVTRDEVYAFREVFHIAAEDEVNAARIFNLARQDVTGYEAYARKIARMFERRPETLRDLLEGLFYIASADGHYHPGEDEFLVKVADIFGVSSADYYAVRARFAPEDEFDPYSVLGIAPDCSLDEIRSKWRQLVRENHPDMMVARGLPTEAIELANRKLAHINTAWETIEKQRAS